MQVKITNIPISELPQSFTQHNPKLRSKAFASVYVVVAKAFGLGGYRRSLMALASPLLRRGNL